MAEGGHLLPNTVRFGIFEVDLRAGELRKRGTKIRLQEKPFQVLAMLLEKPGEVVRREELQNRLWPDTIVEFEHNLNAAVKRLREALGDPADSPRFVETLPRRGYRFIAPIEGQRIVTHRTGQTAEASIAVLPFADMSPQKDQEYFCDGMAEEIINALTKVENLRVASRTSAFQFKNKAEDIRNIGTQLNVRTVVEGSIRIASNKIRITAKLTNVDDGFHLWSESYERDIGNVFALQDEISGTIVTTLQEKLRWDIVREQGPRLVLSKPTYTADLEVYDLYLKGVYFWNEKNVDGVKRSVEYFQKAIEKDSSYPPAYAGLANSYMMLAAWDEDPGSRARLHGMSRELVDHFARLLIPKGV